MWKMIWDHKIQALFQMEKQSGIQGIDLIKPKNINDLAVLNSVIRLMAPEKGGEQPLVTWAKYRKNIDLWYQEMKRYGLSSEEIEWLAKHSAITDGICESQEGLMSLVQEERLGGNTLTFADKCRKGIAKKEGKLFEECEQTFYNTIKEKGCSEKLAHYVWDVLLRVQRGYSFNRSHCLAYSLVGLQEMNLCYRFPIIFWNTACLIADSGGESSGTDYNKMASAISKMVKNGIKVMPPDINHSIASFLPDAENNQILYGLKGILNVGDELIQKIEENRPYKSPRDFLNRINPNKSAMVALIKAGAFDNLMDRKLCMGWYLWETCDKKKRLTLQNLAGLMKYKLIPEDDENKVMARRIYEFNRYLKAITIPANKLKPYYVIDERAAAFLIEIKEEKIICQNGNIFCILKTDWDKIYQKWMDVYREWIKEHHDSLLQELNETIFLEEWNKYAKGNYSSWEMEVLCFYYHEHELANLNNNIYGFVDFFSLPEKPIVDRTFVKGTKTINIYKLFKICGTCIAKDKNKSTVSLLTTTGVVDVKLTRDLFAMFNKQISARGEDGTKHIIERSWFNRGNKLIFQGIRIDDNFIPKKYAASGGHRIMHIDEIIEDELIVRSDRMQGDIEEEEE